ncbi:hypothetical protein LINPERHAP1_LOCUS13692 [Linum perenne]
MVSNARSSNSTGASKSGHGTRCKHHCEAVINVAGTPKNSGRFFYRCPYWRDRRVDCGFFRWADEMQKVTGRKSIGETKDLQRKEDDRVAAIETMLEEIRVIKQSVAVLETRIGYVIVCMCVLIVFLGLGLNKME